MLCCCCLRFFYINTIYGHVTETSCENGLIHNSTCYKIHREEPVRWFTAVNRCLSYNASLAVFDDDVLTYFSPSLLLPTGRLWVGLITSWWTWPDAGYFHLCSLIIHSFIISERRTEGHLYHRKYTENTYSYEIRNNIRKSTKTNKK